MNIDIHDKVIAITGAARGLGRAMALGLARDGAKIAVLARGQAQADQTVAEIRALPGAPDSAGFAADVGDEDEVRAAAAAVDARFGRLDGLISNAGWMPGRSPVLELELSTLRRVIDSNLIGGFLITKHFAPIMIRSGGGRIIYVSSLIGSQPGPGAAAYAASKAGLNMLSNVVHRELIEHGIRTIALAPGLTDTPGMRAIITPDHLARVSASYANGRVGQPEDLVSFAAFLCSDASSHLSGTVLTIRP
jgi:NAD(P)-dependent dehydrogenase (short-subunit alcohol dehydrogenase family)